MQDGRHHDEHPTTRTPTEARAGRVTPGGAVRWVLLVSLSLAVLALLVVLLFFW